MIGNLLPDLNQVMSLPPRWALLHATVYMRGQCKHSGPEHELKTCSVTTIGLVSPCGQCQGISNVVPSSNSRHVQGWCGVKLAFEPVGVPVHLQMPMAERALQPACRPSQASSCA